MNPFLTVGIVLIVLIIGPSEAQDTQRQRFLIGSNATMVCSWSGLEDQNLITLVKWIHRGRRLRGKRYKFGRSGQNHTITIPNIQKKDKGTYTCSPKLDVDMVLSDGKFIVEVVKAALPEPQDIIVVNLTESGSGKMHCNNALTKARYSLELYWTWTQRGQQSYIYLGEEGILGNDTAATYQTYTDDNGLDWLALKTVDEGSAGFYSCNYLYPDGQVFNMTFNVTVKELVGPEDVVKNVTMHEDHESRTLICDISTLRNYDIKRSYWEKDGVELMDGDKYSITETEDTTSLKVKMIEKESDEGVYRCVSELKYYPVAVRFYVDVIKSTRETDFTKWTEFSVCDKVGKKYRFRTCVIEECLEKYSAVFEVDTEYCETKDDEDMNSMEQ